jgi:ankyrin repeat protein
MDCLPSGQRTPDIMEGGLMSPESRSRLNLEQQRKRAKDLRRAHGEGSRDAAARIAAHLPRAQGLPAERILADRFTLSEAQLVIAREAGFSSWPSLRRDLDDARAPDLVEAIVEAALAGDDARVDARIARDPEIAQRSLAVAAALGDAPAALALLADPALADRPAAPRAWPPLLYVCCSRYRRGDPAVVASRIAIVRRLIELGVELDVVGQEPGLTTENVTMFDEHRWQAIEGAAGRIASPELVRVLLDAGASLDRTSAVLSQAVIGESLEVLALLLAASPPWWQVIWALKACAVLDRLEPARLLSARATMPSMREPALGEAIRRGRGAELVEVLLGPGEPRDIVEPLWRAVHRSAVRHGHTTARQLLRARGIDDRDLSPVDRVIAACLTGDHDELARVTAESGYDPRMLRDDDHRILPWAVAAGRDRAVPLLLAAGLDPDVEDRDGEAALHLAVRGRSLGALDALLDAGATLDARNFDARTPLELALAEPDREARDRMVRRLLDAGAQPARMSQLVAGDADEDALRRAGAVEREDPGLVFERAADAVASGDLDTLRELLDDEPGLVHARSPRPHRATLLHYCGANGTEDPRQRTPPNAPAIAQLLLDRGADVEARCKLYGGGADTMGLLLTSAIPREAGLDGELVRVFARAGTRLATIDGDGPLICAIEHGSPRAAQALVECGAPVDNLFTAAGVDRIASLEDLLARGADLDARFHDGGTALHAAASMGCTRAATYLLERGADPTLRDHRWGNTPAALASHFGHTELAEQLAAAEAAWTRSRPMR